MEKSKNVVIISAASAANEKGNSEMAFDGIFGADFKVHYFLTSSVNSSVFLSSAIDQDVYISPGSLRYVKSFDPTRFMFLIVFAFNRYCGRL